MSEHTPRPWRADKQGCVVSDAGMICDVGFMNVHPEANTLLIAAAPETKKQRDNLLATCRNALATLAIMLMPQSDKGVASNEDLTKILITAFEAAIAEAKGAE